MLPLRRRLLTTTVIPPSSLPLPYACSFYRSISTVDVESTARTPNSTLSTSSHIPCTPRDCRTAVQHRQHCIATTVIDVWPCSIPRNSFQSNQTRWKSSALPVHDDDDDDHDDGDVIKPPSSSSTIPFLLADIGEGIAEVELMQWFVHVGDHVHQFDRVCEVQSDKATVEITSRYDGIVHSIEHNVGDMVKVGQPLLFIAGTDSSGNNTTSEKGGSSSASRSVTNHLSTHNGPMVTTHGEKLQIPTIAARYHFDDDHDGRDGRVRQDKGNHTDDSSTMELPSSSYAARGKVLTSPATRKLAREYTLDLSTIVGSGPEGRVTKGDVLTVLKERGIAIRRPNDNDSSSATDTNTVDSTIPPSSSSGTTSLVSQGTSTSATSVGDIDLPLRQDTTLKLRGYNRLMVQAMTAALQIPHMVYSDELDLTTFLRCKSDHPQLGFLPFTIKAVSKALEKYPLLNASFNGSSTDVTLWRDHNIGIAMDTPRGLIVPVVKQCQDKSLPQLAEELNRLKEAAMLGTVSSDDLTGATFTLSNIGAIGSGGTYMSPVVTPPQVAIGAIGKIQRLPRFVSPDSTEVREANICVVSWGGDHRVVDGATMARFHSLVKGYVEDPVIMLMEMK